MKAAYRKTLDENFTVAEAYKANKADWLDGRWAGIKASRRRVIGWVGTRNRPETRTNASFLAEGGGFEPPRGC